MGLPKGWKKLTWGVYENPDLKMTISIHYPGEFSVVNTGYHLIITKNGKEVGHYDGYKTKRQAERDCLLTIRMYSASRALKVLEKVKL